MTTQQVLDIVRDRGLRVFLGDDGRPRLARNGQDGAVTDALLAVLRRHRERIIEALKREQREAS